MKFNGINRNRERVREKSLQGEIFPRNKNYNNLKPITKYNCSERKQ